LVIFCIKGHKGFSWRNLFNMRQLERWSTRELEREINSMLFERIALNRSAESFTRIEGARIVRSHW